MWGEIEPPIKTQPSLCRNEDVDGVKQPEDATTLSLEGHITFPVPPQQSQTPDLVSSATQQHDWARPFLILTMPLATVTGRDPK